MSILEVENLKKSFSSKSFGPKVTILENVSFHLEKGTATGFLGKNGAGKTTLIKCLLGLLLPDSGKIHFFDEGELTLDRKKRIGFLPERPYFYEHLTGYEFLNFYGRLSKSLTGRDLKNRISEVLKMVSLNDAAGRPLRKYSKGMLQRIGLAQALVHRPDLIILDEPMSGLDPDGRHSLKTIIKGAVAGGTSVFFSSHLVNDIEEICRNVLVLDQGKVLYSGRTDQLVEEVRESAHITFLENGNRKQIKVDSEEEINQKIDLLRKEKKSIIEISWKKKSLEDSFISLTNRKVENV